MPTHTIYIQIAIPLIVLGLYLWAIFALKVPRMLKQVAVATAHVVKSAFQQEQGISSTRRVGLLIAALMLLVTEELFSGIFESLTHFSSFSPLMLFRGLGSKLIVVVATAVIMKGIERAVTEEPRTDDEKIRFLALNWRERRFDWLADFLQVHDCSGLIDPNHPKWESAPKTPLTKEEICRCVTLVRQLAENLPAESATSAASIAAGATDGSTSVVQPPHNSSGALATDVQIRPSNTGLYVAIAAVLVSACGVICTGLQTQSSLELTRRQILLAGVPQISVTPSGHSLVINNDNEYPIDDIKIYVSKYLARRDSPGAEWRIAERVSAGNPVAASGTLASGEAIVVKEPVTEVPALGAENSLSFPIKVAVIRYCRRVDKKRFIYVEPFVDHSGFASLFEHENSLFVGGDSLFDIAARIRAREEARYGRVAEEGVRE